MRMTWPFHMDRREICRHRDSTIGLHQWEFVINGELAVCCTFLKIFLIGLPIGIDERHSRRFVWDIVTHIAFSDQ